MNPPTAPAAPPAAQTPNPISFASTDHLQMRKDLEPHIEQSIEKRLKKYAAWFGTSIVLVIVGALVATIWQLNGAIYQAVGRESQGELYSEVLKAKIQQLERENEIQKKALACYSDQQVKEKKGAVMGIKIGDVDIANEIVSLHYQLIRTQLIFERIISANPQIAVAITPEVIRQIDDQAIAQLQKKFPNMGISKTGTPTGP